eukprot:gene33290-55887_t
MLPLPSPVAQIVRVLFIILLILIVLSVFGIIPGDYLPKLNLRLRPVVVNGPVAGV